MLLSLPTRTLVETCGVQDKLHAHSLACGLQSLRESKPRVDYSAWAWSAAGVQRWLGSLGLARLQPLFEAAAVHGHVLFDSTLSTEEVAGLLGVTDPIQIRSLASAVRQLALSWDARPRASVWSVEEVGAWLREALELPPRVY